MAIGVSKAAPGVSSKLDALQQKLVSDPQAAQKIKMQTGMDPVRLIEKAKAGDLSKEQVQQLKDASAGVTGTEVLLGVLLTLLLPPIGIIYLVLLALSD